MPVESRPVLTRDTKLPKRRIPTLLIVFFLFFQTVGLDFGFASVLKRKYRSIVQRITLFVSILSFVVMLIFIVVLYNDIWCWFNVVKNNGFILVLTVTRYKLYHLIYDINGICDLTTKQINILNIITILYTFIIYMVNITLKVVRCISEKQPYCGILNSTFYFVVYYGISLSLDAIVMAQVIIIYYLKCSINIIKVLLKKPNRKLGVYEKSYRAIADCYDKIRPLYDWMIILELGVNVPKLMGNIWSGILYVKDNGKWFSFMAEFIVAFQLATQICIPAITVSALNFEIDDTKQLLNEEIMTEKDERKNEELKRILHYITKRPLRHLVWTFIPIDLRLFLTLFSLCTSYLIVALQFSQMF